MDIINKNLDELKNHNNSKEILKRIFKYIIQGIAIAIAAYTIPMEKLEPQYILFIALTGASTFAIIDLSLPSININKNE